MQGVVGEPVTIFKEKVNFKKPGSGYFAPHQDAQAGWNQYGHTIHYNLAVALDDCTLANGCLFIAPTEHNRELLGEEFGPMDSKVVEGLEWSPVECKAGDAFVFDSFLPHKSEINGTETQRRLILLTYSLEKEGDARETYHTDKIKNHPPEIYKKKGEKYRGYVI